MSKLSFYRKLQAMCRTKMLPILGVRLHQLPAKLDVAHFERGNEVGACDFRTVEERKDPG